MDSSPDRFRLIIRQVTGGAPDGDVVFLPTDAAGGAGALNGRVLAHFGLGPAFIPDAETLEPGYAVRKAAERIFCFVVTVGSRDTAANLRRNLALALEDPQIAEASSLWLPLMGTGAGRLTFSQSRQIIEDCLLQSSWGARVGVSVILSAPGPSESDAAPTDDRDPAADLFALPRAKAADELLRVASRLVKVRRSSEARLTTTVLFFALCQSGDPQTGALAADPAAAGFRVALNRLAGADFPALFTDNFDTDQLLATDLPEAYPRPTANVAQVLKRAQAAAVEKGAAGIEVGGIIEALLTLPEAGFETHLQVLGLTKAALLEAYRDESSQFVELRLLNDLAGSVDRLGYARYAQAIADFLTHAETPPPLSISIQAPWGAGKSSLMLQLRERLDPEAVRTRSQTPPGAKRVRLKLRDVVNFLNGKPADRQGAAADGARLWTVWFNAWKYDTSEQVWAGLVDAIVAQISERLPPAERELFLLKLHLSRIDDGLVRKKIYDRIASLWWATARRWIVAGAGAIAALLGAGMAAGVVTPQVPALARAGYAGALGIQAALAIYVVASYFISRAKTHSEPASFSLSEYIRVPDYSQAVGSVHAIHKDLMRVLSLAPGAAGEKPDPIVVFIDDLDRCSPSKVAAVVEGVSMFLASDLYRCLFVIGMDPQLIAAALESEHAAVIQKLPSYERAAPLGWRFMDKFVQLPFTIPPSSAQVLDHYVESFGRVRAAASKPALASTAAPPGPKDAPPPVQPERTAAAAQPPSQPPSLKEAARQDVESRDVKALILKLLAVAGGNPRELKRMANLARLYLELRNARRRAEPLWEPPPLDAYARWIALTSRWPDAMRWLLWGTDEATWQTAELSEALAVRRLRIMEDAAAQGATAADWQTKLHQLLRVPVADPSDWATDVKLFDVFKAEAALPEPQRLSAAASAEFW